MEWKSNGSRDGCLGMGYRSGSFLIEEALDYRILQQKYGGRLKDYYWCLKYKGDVVAHAGTAKALKAVAEHMIKEWGL